MDRKSKIRTAGAAKCARPAAELIVCRSLQLDPIDQRLQIDGLDVPISPKVFDLLQLLLSAPQRVHTREEIFEHLWPNAVLLDANLTTTVSQLRKVLNDELRPFLRTVPKVGYSWDAVVTKVPRPSKEMQAVASEAPAGFIEVQAISAQDDESLRVAESYSHAKMLVSADSNFEKKDAFVRYRYVVLVIAVMVFIGMFWHSNRPATQRYVLLVTAESDATDIVPETWIINGLRDSLVQQLGLSPSIRVMTDAEPAGMIAAQQLLGTVDGADAHLRLNFSDFGAQSNDFKVSVRMDTAKEKLLELEMSVQRADMITSGRSIAEHVLNHLSDGAVSLPQAVIMPRALVSYEQASIAEARGEVDVAIAEYENALKLSPGFTLARMRVAELLGQVQRTDLAAANWQVVFSDMKNLGAESRRVALARSHVAKGDMLGAANVYQNLARDFPDAPQHRLKRIEMLIGAGGKALIIAEEELSDLLRTAPSPAVAMSAEMLQGRLRYAQGRSKERYEAYLRAEKIARSINAHYSLGDILAQLAFLRRDSGDIKAAHSSFAESATAYRKARVEKSAQYSELLALRLPLEDSLGSIDRARERIEAFTQFARRANAEGYGSYAGFALFDAAIFEFELYNFEAARKLAEQADVLLRNEAPVYAARPRMLMVAVDMSTGSPVTALQQIDKIKTLPHYDLNMVSIRFTALLEAGEWKRAAAELNDAKSFWKASSVGGKNDGVSACLEIQITHGRSAVDRIATLWPVCEGFARTQPSPFSAEMKTVFARALIQKGDDAKLQDLWRELDDEIASLPEGDARTILTAEVVDTLIVAGELESAKRLHRSINPKKVASMMPPLASRYWLNDAQLSIFNEHAADRFKAAMQNADASIGAQQRRLRAEYRLLLLAKQGPRRASPELQAYLADVEALGNFRMMNRAKALESYWRITSDAWQDSDWWKWSVKSVN